MSKDDRDFEDPKIAFTMSILRQDEYITACLSNMEESGPNTGFHKEIARAALSMALLLRRLHLAEGDTEMIKLRDNITLENYDAINEKYILAAYAKIHDYLNDTIYADFHKAKPKFTNEGHI